MDKTLQMYIDKLNALNFKDMYNGDFFLTWEKTDDEIEAVFTVADALRYMRENNISTRIFDSGIGISSAAIVNGLYGDDGYTISTYSVHQYYSNKKYINDDIIRTGVNTWSDSVFTIAHSQNAIQFSSGTTVNWVVFS